MLDCHNHSLFHTQNLEEEILKIDPSYEVGPLELVTDPLKLCLQVECKAWKQAYARSLNLQCSRDMDELHKYFTVMQKRLNHPIDGLEDIKTIKVSS